MFFSVNMSVSWVSNQVKIGDFGLSKMADASPEGIIELSTRGAGTSWPLDLVYGLVPPPLHVQMCCSISFLHSYVWVAFCLVGLSFALVWPLVGRWLDAPQQSRYLPPECHETASPTISSKAPR